MTMRKDFSIIDSILDIVVRYYLFFLIPILLMGAFNLLYGLKETPIYSWDEARHGVSAYEMLRSGEFIVNTYGYRNDYWNLKPPLSFWAIMLGYRIMGFNPLGLRLFSAIAAFATILVIALFARYRHGELASIISALILITSPKYIVIHSGRTGDADSLFVFFFTAAVISMILSEKRITCLYLCGLFFSLAFLTKSWHSLNIPVIVFLYLLFSGNIFRLKPKEWLLFFICSGALIAAWGILRYIKDGLKFIRSMINYDLLSRSAITLEGHVGDGFYYFRVLVSYYKIWLLLLAGSLAVCYLLYRGQSCVKFIGSTDWKYFTALFLWISVPLVLFSAARTKIGWYILPVYPPIALCIGASCNTLLRGKARSLVIQAAVIAAIARGAAEYENVIVRHINMFKNDAERVTFTYFSIPDTIKGAGAYISYGNKPNPNYGPKSEFKEWRQSDLLSAELYWDLKPMAGGIAEFLGDKGRSVLILYNDGNAEKIIRDNRLTILGKSDSAYILKKTEKPHIGGKGL